MTDHLQNIFQSIMEGNAPSVNDGVQAALEANLIPSSILNDGMIAAMTEVGRLFEDGEYFVPEMLISARAMQSGLNILKPNLAKGELGAAGTAIIGTVAGDLHDIGKNLVGMMMEGAGFKIVDLGTDVSAEDFVAAVQEHTPKLICMSALLTTTMPSMEKTIIAVEEAGVRDQIKVLIGGAPVTQAFADKIGADGFAPDASQATRLAKELLA